MPYFTNLQGLDVFVKCLICSIPEPQDGCVCKYICSRMLKPNIEALSFPSPMQLVDYRVEFSKWWVSEFKTVKFPHQGTVFDYFLDGETKKWVPWTEKVPNFELDPEIPLQV